MRSASAVRLSMLMGMALCGPLLWAQSVPSEAAARKALVEDALRYQGVPYVYGSESPTAFDCSGFVRYVYAETLGITLPRTAREQWKAGKSVPLAEARSGDVIVFDTVGGAPSHVGLILDNTSFIHAASAGAKTGVTISKLAEKYFAPKILGTRVYVIRPELAPEPQTAAKPTSPTATEAQAAKPATPKPDAQKAETPPKEAPRKPADSTAAIPPPRPLSAAEVAKKLATKEPVVSTVGFTITDELSIVSDKIPAKTGTALQFAVTNGTEKDGVFEILFYRMDLDPSKVTTLRRDRVSLKRGGFVEVEPFTFTEPGQYKLILKTHDNMKRVERTWKVVDIK